MLSDRLNQTATYWPPGKPTGFGGREWGKPQQIRCRWQEHQQMIRDKEGNERVSTAVVYLDTPINFEGRIYRGTSTQADPTTSDIDTYEPQAIQEMVSLGGRAIGWKVYL